MLVMFHCGIRLRSVQVHVNEEWLVEIVYCWIGCGTKKFLVKEESNQEKTSKNKNGENIRSVSQHDQYSQRLIIPNICVFIFNSKRYTASDINDNANVEKSSRSKKVEWKQMKMKQVKKPLRHYHWAVFVILYFFGMLQDGDFLL